MKFVSLCCMLTLGTVLLASDVGAAGQREDPSAVSKKLLRSLVEGDSATIFKYLRPADIEKLHLTKSKVKAVMDELVFPATRKLKPLGSIIKSVDVMPLTARAIMPGVGPHRTKVFIAVATYPEKPGPRATFKNFMEIAWLLRAAYAERSFPVGVANPRAVLRGLKHDRPRLEALGVKSFLEDLPSAGIETYASMQKNLEMAIAHAKKPSSIRRSSQRRYSE